MELARKRMCFRMAVGLLSVALAAPLHATERLTFCLEKKVVIPWRLTDTTGLNFDILAMVAARHNIEFRYQSLPWKRCLARLARNEVDGAFSVSFTQNRLPLGAYPGGATPDARMRLHESRYILLRRKGSKIDWDGKAFHHVDGPISYQLGYSVGDMLRRHDVQANETGDSLSVIARRILSGDIAAAALYDSDAENLMTSGPASKLEMLPAPLIEKPYFLILSHTLVKTRPELAGRIWKGIEDARNSPEYIKKARAAGVDP